jgi:hypothetical protein
VCVLRSHDEWHFVGHRGWNSVPPGAGEAPASTIVGMDNRNHAGSRSLNQVGRDCVGQWKRLAGVVGGVPFRRPRSHSASF